MQLSAMIYVLAGLIFAYLLVRLILPLPVGSTTKLLLSALLVLVSQQHLFIRLAFGSLSSPELPVPVLLALNWSFVSLCFLAGLLLIRDAFLLLRRFIPDLKKLINPPFSPGRRRAMVTAMAAMPAAYGIEQGMAPPGVHHLEVRLPRLPKELDGLTLVQISDLHVSPLVGEQRVRTVVDKVNALKPDLILFTGDIVDGMPARRAESVAPLKNLRARYGVFGCAGNHEYYSDYSAWMQTLPALGLAMLLNSHVVLNIRGRELVLAGVTDTAAKRLLLPGPDIAGALAGAPEDAVRILLAHRPGSAPENAKAGVDLQLSGHTHGGQVLGVDQLVAQLNHGFLRNWYQIGGMRLYVSSGAGSWLGFPVRLGVPPEIACIVLRHAG